MKLLHVATVAILAAVVILGQAALVKLGEPQAVWLYCRMLSFCN